LLKKLKKIVNGQHNIEWTKVATAMSAQFQEYDYAFTKEGTRKAYYKHTM
jgi:hypothetical protein